jgi:hypothetical protein
MRNRRDIIRRMNGGAPKPEGITPQAEAFIRGRDNKTLHRFIRECEGSRPKFIRMKDEETGRLRTRKLRDARHEPRDATISRQSPYGTTQHLCTDCLNEEAEAERKAPKGRARGKRRVQGHIT